MADVYYTPKEYEAAFNKPWGDRDAVYYVDYADTNDVGASHRFWRVGTLEDVKTFTENIDNGEILCATTNCPPDDYFHNRINKKIYRVELVGCHDATVLNVELNEKEYEFLVKISRLVEKEAKFSCMPTLNIILSENEVQNVS